ncbi:MAG TPA: hypothetical protein VK957_17470 [Lunatimonas sp.]|nr:hypothetical protein [Lunatimonas sp.]
MERILHAGAVKVHYQDGFIRYISSGGVEIIRMINHALRDQNWGTIPMVISNEHIRQSEEEFQINYEGSFEKDDISYHLTCQITGSNQGTIQFTYRGKAQSEFKRNRIGFTVLHPIASCAGKPVKIINESGAESRYAFPEAISPHQPFRDIKEMHWNPSLDISASIYFDGDVFETEDQRNWTDASYKTYCTPLEIPFPVVVRNGDEISQQIILKVNSGGNFNQVDLGTSHITLSVAGEPVQIPEWGTQANTNLPEELADKVMNIIQPKFLRVDVSLDRLADSDLEILTYANQKNIPVELALFTDHSNPIESIKTMLHQLQSVTKILLFGDTSKTTPKELLDCIKKLKLLLPKVDIFGGTDAFFTELNRERVDAEELDGVTYSINPQVHAFDNQSLIETLPAQGYTVTSAKQIYPDKKIAVSPVSFHMRWNPNATDPEKHLRTPTGWTDDRQYSLFGACWFLFSLKYLTEAGASSLTYFEWEGKNGWVKETANGIGRSPILEIWSRFKFFSSLIPSSSSDPLVVDCMVFSDNEKSELIAVNWTKDVQVVELPGGYSPLLYWQEVEGELLARKADGASGPTYQLPPFALLVAEKGL